MSQVLWISQTTSYPRMTMEFHFYILHQKTSIILQVWHCLGYSRLAHQAGNLYSCHDTITSMDLAHLFILHVFSKHGIPSYITSNRGSEFVSNFFHSLGTALDIQLHFTLGYHSEDDRQTNHMNQTLKQYLHIYCNY